jgi:hypothetical protein
MKGGIHMEWHYFNPERDDSVRALEHLPITEGTELTVIIYPFGVSGNEPIRMEVNCNSDGMELPVLAEETFSSVDEAMALAPLYAKAIQELKFSRPDLHLKAVMEKLLKIHLDYLQNK